MLCKENICIVTITYTFHLVSNDIVSNTNDEQC